MSIDLKNNSEFTYHNSFQNTIFSTENTTDDMSKQLLRQHQDAVAKDPELQNFTATGRPIPHPKDSAKGRGLNSMMVAESWGNGAPNLLPVRFNDDSVISVPVLPLSNVVDSSEAIEQDYNPVKQDRPTSRLGSLFKRKSSSSKKNKQPAFVMRDMRRSEYLERYAKDDDGKYIGTKDPAPDCILNHEKDQMKYRKGLTLREELFMPAPPAFGF